MYSVRARISLATVSLVCTCLFACLVLLAACAPSASNEASDEPMQSSSSALDGSQPESAQSELQPGQYITGSEKIKYALGQVIADQHDADAEITTKLQDASYTLAEPFVMENPYGIAPLSALVIFTTDKETSIDVSINDQFHFSCESAQHHAVPLYGMRDGEDNEITLSDNAGNIKALTITTKAYAGPKLRVEHADTTRLDDQLYFLSPNFMENCIYDKDGTMLWRIDGDYASDIEFLPNGHFYISDPHQGTNGVKINYASFLEMDYLGKIYKQHILEYGYHHELLPLANGDILTTGAQEGSPFLEAVLYIVDGQTCETKYALDMYDKLHGMAPEWVESLGTDFDFVLNSIDYDPDTNDVLLSFRGIGVVTRMNLDTQEFAWMFGDPANLPDELDPYLLTVEDDTKYPYGEHSASFTEDGNVAFHNNDADQFHMDEEMLSGYLDNYTTNVVVAIDEQARSLRTVWEYDAGKKEFSKVGGMLSFLENGNTLVDFGYSMKPAAYDKPESTSINDTAYLQGVIEELGPNDELLFRGTLDGLIFRAYKTMLYPETVPNFEPTPFVKIDGSRKEYVELDVDAIEQDLLDAEPLGCEFDVLVNRAMIDRSFEQNDVVDLFFVGEEGTEAGSSDVGASYQCPFKKAGEDLHAFNSERYGPLISVPEGRYKVYVSINGQLFDSDTIMVFE